MQDFDPQSTGLEGYGDLRLGREWVRIVLATILSVVVSAMLLVCVLSSHVRDTETASSAHDPRIALPRQDTSEIYSSFRQLKVNMPDFDRI